MEELKNRLNKIELSEKGDQLPFSISQAMYSRVSSKELLHSEIIATLLDPNGKHNLGELPLGKFLEMLGIGNSDDFGTNLSKTKVQTERGVEGRRIDILLTNGSNAIIIENKLNDAVDQLNQLCDYTKSIQNEGKEVLKVVYLPFYEYKSAKEKVDGVDVVNIWPKYLIKWLKECGDNTICTQYIELLEYMNQTNRNYMEAKKIQTKLNDEELSKLIDIATIVSSPEWGTSILNTVKDEVVTRLQKEGVTVKYGYEVKGAISLYVENYDFWLEIYYPYRSGLGLFLVDWSVDKNILRKIVINNKSYNFKHYSIENGGRHYFADEDILLYKYPCKEDFERLITNVCEILKVSHKQ